MTIKDPFIKQLLKRPQGRQCYTEMPKIGLHVPSFHKKFKKDTPCTILRILTKNDWSIKAYACIFL